MSGDAIQDLIDACECPNLGPGSGGETHVRAQAQHTANRDVIASLRSSLEGRAAEVELLKAERDRLRWGVVANAGRLSREGRLPRWAHVREAAGVGSTTARELCTAAGFDPDEQVGQDAFNGDSS